MSFVETITQMPLPSDQYVDQVFDKEQIYLHHTASSPSPYGVLSWWKQTPEKVSTAFLIVGTPDKSKKWKDGEIIQCFSSAKAGWHLGLTQKDLARGKPGNKSSVDLNMKSIGIELTNYGYLSHTEHGFKAYDGTVLPDSRVIELDTPYRGYKFYEKYTDAQLESTAKLLKFLGDRYDIDIKYKGIEIFEIDKRALRGERGVFCHSSVRPKGEKCDWFPQPSAIEMLKTL